MPIDLGVKDMTNMQWGRVSTDGSGTNNPTYNNNGGGAPLIDGKGRVWVRQYGLAPVNISGALISPNTLTKIPIAGVLITSGAEDRSAINSLYVWNSDTETRFLQLFQVHALPNAGDVPTMSIPINPQSGLPPYASDFLNIVTTLINGNNVTTGLALGVSSTFATYTALASTVMYYSYRFTLA